MGRSKAAAAAHDDTEAAAAPAPDLEAGIAAIFASLREADAGDGPPPEAAPAADSGATFDLLGELDRLWRDGEN